MGSKICNCIYEYATMSDTTLFPSIKIEQNLINLNVSYFIHIIINVYIRI